MPAHPSLPVRLIALAACTVGVAVAAAPAHAARWMGPLAVPGTSGAGLPYDVAVGGDGTIAVAYQEPALTGSGNVRVVVRRAGRWRPTKVVVRAGGYGERSPRVAVTGSGEVLAAWVRTTSRGAGPTRGPYVIEARIRSRTGRWGPVQRLGVSAHFVANGLDVAANARGDAVVVWRGFRRVTSRRTLDQAASAYRRAGGRFAPARVLREPDAAAEQGVAIGRDGVAHAVWTSGLYGSTPVVRYARRTRTTAWSSPRTAAGAPATRPAVAVTDGGAAVVAWRAARVDSEGEGIQRGIISARVRSPGGRWFAPQVLSPAPAVDVTLGATPAIGETIALWRGAPPTPIAPDDAGIAWTVRSPAGSFGPASVIAPDEPVAPWPPGLALVGDGTAVAAWSGPFGDRPGGVRVSVRPPRGAFSPAAELSPRGLYPDAAGGPGRAVVLFGSADTDRLRWAQWLP